VRRGIRRRHMGRAPRNPRSHLQGEQYKLKPDVRPRMRPERIVAASIREYRRRNLRHSDHPVADTRTGEDNNRWVLGHNKFGEGGHAMRIVSGAHVCVAWLVHVPVEVGRTV